MENFVNKIKTKDGIEYDIRDERVPQILAESAGKVLAVNEEGTAFEFKEVSSDRSKLYKHTIMLDYGSGARLEYILTTSQPLSSVTDIINADNNSVSKNTNIIKYNSSYNRFEQVEISYQGTDASFRAKVADVTNASSPTNIIEKTFEQLSTDTVSEI